VPVSDAYQPNVIAIETNADIPENKRAA